MNTRLNLTVVAMTALLASCYMPPPRQPHPPRTGVNLDRPASGDRSARESRYLQEEVRETPPPPADAPVPPPDSNTPPNTDAASVQTPSNTPPPPPPDKPKDSPPPAAGGNTPPPAATANELPYGVPVPGKKGFVYSPYDKSAGFVDVRDIGPGTKVRCPYTGKIFRVP